MPKLIEIAGPVFVLAYIVVTSMLLANQSRLMRVFLAENTRLREALGLREGESLEDL